MQILLAAAATTERSPEQCDREAQHDGRWGGTDVSGSRVDRSYTHQHCLIIEKKLTGLKVEKVAGKLYNPPDSCSIWSNADGGALQVVILCGTARGGTHNFWPRAVWSPAGVQEIVRRSPASMKKGFVMSWRHVWLEVRWRGATAANGLVKWVCCLLPATQHRDSCYVGKLDEWAVNKNSSGE